MKADDVTGTLELTLAASGLDRADVRRRPRLLSDNGSGYVAKGPADWMSDHGMAHVRGAPWDPMTHRCRCIAIATAMQDRALASYAQEPHLVGKLLSAR